MYRLIVSAIELRDGSKIFLTENFRAEIERLADEFWSNCFGPGDDGRPEAYEPSPEDWERLLFDIVGKIVRSVERSETEVSHRENSLGSGGSGTAFVFSAFD